MESRWNIRTIYLYLVCLITLIMGIFSTVGLVREITDLVVPPPHYGPGPLDMKRMATEKPGADVDPALFEAQREFERQNRRSGAIREIAGDTAMLLIALPVYLYHWRKVQHQE